MQLKILVKEGELVPTWYGIAYMDHPMRLAVCYPLGLHWIVGVFRELHYRFKKSFYGQIDISRARGSAYKEGFDRGFEAGHKIGLGDGITIGHRDGWDMAFGYMNEQIEKERSSNDETT